MTYPKLLLAFFLLLSGTCLQAQEVKGIVGDRATRLMLKSVDVYNLTNKQRTFTNDKGEFSIKAQVNQILVFTQPGYASDTLLLVNTKNIKRYLTFGSYQLNTVEVSAKKFDFKTQYADVYREAKVVDLSVNKPLAFSPSRYFSKKGKAARKLKRKLELEDVARKIDYRFNEAAVKAITPLKGAELEYFMVLYRPSLKALDKMDDEVFKFYLMDSFKEFNALPPSKKVIPSLKD